MWTEHHHSHSLLHSTSAARIHRAHDERGDGSVIVKTTVPEAGSEALVLFRHDYALAREAPAPWRLRPLEWREKDEQTLSVFADPTGDTLQHWAAQSHWPLTRRLEMALALVDVVAGIHSEGLIHRDICPSAFLCSDQCATPVVLDSALATQLNQETVSPLNLATPILRHRRPIRSGIRSIWSITSIRAVSATGMTGN